MIGGVTRHMLLHLTGVPHLHVNRPLDPIHKNPHIFDTAYFFYTNRTRMNELIHWFPVDGRLIRVEKMRDSCWRGLWHIRHFRNEKGTWAEMRPAIVSGIVTGDALISYWPVFSLSPVTVPEVFANVNSVQFPSPLASPDHTWSESYPESHHRLLHPYHIYQHCEKRKRHLL